MNSPIRIGTRGSKLALWQAHYVKDTLEKIGQEVSITVIKTQGDRVQDLTFDKLEAKGFFTKEIETALSNNTVDLAVHSMKDLPTSSPEGLVTTAVSYREDPSDWLLIRSEVVDNSALLKLPQQARVGTSSARRKAQMLDLLSDIQLLDIRGNVPTRIQKLRDGQFDAILLAGAGIKRLDLDISDLYVLPFNPKEFIPAPAQGVLAYQVRKEDKALRRILHEIHQQEVADCTNVERKVLQLMEGGCQMPLGVYCEKDPIGNYHIWAAFATSWSAAVKRVRLSSSTRFELAEKTVAALKTE